MTWLTANWHSAIGNLVMDEIGAAEGSDDNG